MPHIVLGELRAGFAAETLSEENEVALRWFLDTPDVVTVALSDTTTLSYGLLYVELKAIGKPMGTNDMWIAALVREHTPSFLTLDSDFSRVPGLKIVVL